MTSTMPLTELTTTIKMLCREIGVVNTARFINQFGCVQNELKRSRHAHVPSWSHEGVLPPCPN
jgi:hypothetical protein